MRRSTVMLLAISLPLVVAQVACSGPEPSGRGQAGARDNPTTEPPGHFEDDPGEGPEHDAGTPAKDGSTDSADSTDSGPAPDGAPTPDRGPTSGFVHVATALSRACRVRVEGTVECWGANYGELGVEPTAGCSYRGGLYPLPSDGESPGPCTPNPTLIPGLTDVVEIAMGRGICALRRDGTVACWGLNDGELGVPANDTCRAVYPSSPGQKCTKTPTTVAGLSNVVELAAGFARMCARRADGTVACWGWNESGELGVPRTGTCGTVGCTTAPTTVAGVTNAVDLGVGAWHSCAVLADGTARCWGLNDEGQLGTATTETCPVLGASKACARAPAPVLGLVAQRDIDAGNAHSCAVDAAGLVRCWGNNHDGQLGDATRSSHMDPRPVAGLGAAAEVYTGPSNTCARLRDGTVACWGGSTFDPFGFTSPACSSEEESYDTCQTTPRAVPGITNLRTMAVDDSFACYVRLDGAIECKGDVIGFRFGV